MSYLKNTAGQKVNILLINSITGDPLAGDASNITAKISIDSGAAASLSDTNPAELDATNFPGLYVFDLTQSETNGDVITIKATSTTASTQADLINIYTVAVSDYQADISSLPTALQIYNYFTVSGNETAFQADVSSLATAASIAALNDFDPASDTVANVTLVDTVTTNTDMVGTNNAALASSLSITNSSVNTIKTVTNNLPDSGALSSLATASELATVDTVVDAIKAKTDQFAFTISNQVDANALTGGGGDDAATIYAYFTAGSNEDAFKAELGSGSGSVTFTLTVNDGSNPIEGVSVWITTDSAGSNVVAGASNTNSFGQVTFSLDPGTYYQFNQLGGYTFNNPTTITVS